MLFTRLSAFIGRAHCLARAALATALLGALVACGSDGTTPITGVQTLRPLSADFTTRKAVNYSPFRTFNRDTEVITKAMIKEDMDLLLTGGYNLIRLFDSTDMVAKQTLEVIRDNNLNIRVYLGAYLRGGRDSTSSANDAEVARTIALANQFNAIVIAVSVGNEMLLFGDNKIDRPATLGSYITKVRNAINQPVTTDDNYNWWRTADPVITNTVDFVAIHSYPEQDTIYAEGLWDWRQIGVPEEQRAAAMMDASIVAAQNQFGAVRQYLNEVGLRNMPILLTETGWHAVNTGNAGGNLPFRASAANQKMYYDRLRAWEAAERTTTGPRTIFYFEAFDEPWKLDDNFWGLFTVERKARCAIQELSDTWAKDLSQPCDEASALFFVELSIKDPVTATRFTLFADAVTPGEALLPNPRWDAFGNNMGGVTANAPPVTTASAPIDNPTSLQITPTPADYGWGLLRQSDGGASSNLSAFSNGTLTAWIRTDGYPGKIQIAITSDTEDRKGAEAVITLAPGDYSYCNTNAWCQVTIPISAFVAANPNLDLRAVLLPFVIRDIFSQTGKPLGTTGLPLVYIDSIYWTK